MSARLTLFRVLLVAACSFAVATLFVPIIFIYFLVGGIPQGGAVSLWTISPLLASMTMLLTVVVTARALACPSAASRRHLLIIGVLSVVASVAALLYTFSPVAAFGFHPCAMSGVALSGLLLIGAGLLLDRPGPHRALQFGLRATFIYIAFAALICGFVRAAMR